MLSWVPIRIVVAWLVGLSLVRSGLVSSLVQLVVVVVGEAVACAAEEASD